MLILLKGNFHALERLRGNAKGASNNLIAVRSVLHILRYYSSTGSRPCSSAPTPIAFAFGLGSQVHWAKIQNQTGIPGINFFASGRSRTNCIMLNSACSKARGGCTPPKKSGFYDPVLKNAVDLFNAGRHHSCWQARCAESCARYHSFVRARREVLETPGRPRGILT